MTDLKEYRLRIAKAAVEDLDNIYRYISDSADAETAKNVRGQLEAAMRSLRQIPKRQRTFLVNTAACLSAAMSSFIK
ncbi:MAG: type II toxin-antitoxin system RelE/ParE family toxin [Pyramidobacter sp.]|nr:type II toxin-antitoxin system RelE/ParE family toxin [Pyramidobacter sp.]